MLHRLLNVGGVLAVASGVAVILPAIADYRERGSFSASVAMVISIGTLLLVGGGAAVIAGRRRPHNATMPAMVRAAVTAAVFFVAFCMLEFSDGLLRQNGRIFYWTSVLFLPALALLYGLVSTRRWAWWITRIASAIAVLWCHFSTANLFANLRSEGIPVP
jgi:uncharacterized membrane protein YozB (DUF420 family)